jgi:hypothetical protein
VPGTGTGALAKIDLGSGPVPRLLLDKKGKVYDRDRRALAGAVHDPSKICSGFAISANVCRLHRQCVILGRTTVLMAKQKTCGVCGQTYTLTLGQPHERSHIVRISSTEPSWLPAHLRAVAAGEYTFKCDRCNSYPSSRWPSEGAAFAGMGYHLAAAHDTGPMSGLGARRLPTVEMIRVV